MSVRYLLILTIFISACGEQAPDYKVDRTLQISAEQLQKIKANPYVKRYRSGGGPAARLTGLDKDPWPAAVSFLELGPYLVELGFDKGQMIVEIDDEGVHDIFVDRWRTMRIKRPAGFHRDHYRDLIRYLFVERDTSKVTLKLLVNVPSSASKAGDYQPQFEYWQIDIQR